MFLFDIITERKRAEEALRQVSASWRNRETDSALRSWAVELPGYPLHLVRRRRPLQGIFSPDLCSFVRSISLIGPPGRCRQNADKLTNHVAGENPADLEFRAILSDGTFRILKGRGVSVHSDEENRRFTTGTLKRSLSASGWKRKRPSLQAQFHQPQKMESVGRLAGGRLGTTSTIS